MNYLSNNSLAYLSDDNIYQSTYGIVENNEIIDNDDNDNDKEGEKEKNFLTDTQIQNLLENYENNLNNNNKNKNKKLLFIIFFILFLFFVFCLISF